MTDTGGAGGAGDLELNRRRLAAVAAQAGAVRWQIASTGVVIAALAWRAVPHELVLGWLLLMLGMREWRAHALAALVRDDTRPIALRLRALVAWNTALGASNGLAALAMWWLEPTWDALLTMILVSWAAGAVSASAPLLRAYVVYALCVFTPLAAMWIVEGGTVGLVVAALIAMFARVQYGFARQNADTFEQSYRIRLENEGLVRELAAARDAAEAANRAKSRFLAAASHDLRQPLHALTLHSGLLAHDPRAADNPEIAEAVVSSIDSLGRLLDSLLDISKLDAGVVAVERRPLRVGRLVGHVVALYALPARDKQLGLTFECPDDAVVESDPLLLERLLRNLLDNALKYTDHGGVAVTVVADGDELELAVHDSGRGIAPELREQVFEEFFQVTTPGAPPPPGLGLGLAIVQRLAALLGVRVGLQSQPGIGSTFTLRLKRLAQAGVEAVAPPASQANLRGLKVLLVDDEEAVRAAMQRVLRHFGCEPMLAATGAEALALADVTVPDIVLADLRLGAEDSGARVIAQLRERHPGLPALLISADVDAQRLRDAAAQGLRLLHKPATLPRLREAIAAALADRTPVRQTPSPEVTA